MYLLRHYDVIIAGAGPSGSYCAYNLARHGYKVLLMDRQGFPRQKPCGGLLTAKALNLLGDWADQIPAHCTIKNIKLFSRSDKELIWTTDSILGKTVSRKEFDYFLLEKSKNEGVQIFEKTCLQGVEEKNGIVYADTSNGIFSSRYFVGADGALSFTARYLKLNPLFSHFKRGFTLSQIIHTKETPINHSTVELFFIPYLGGFGWCFPLRDSLNIGVGASMFGYRSLYGFYKRFLAYILDKKGIYNVELNPKGAFVPAGGFSRCLGKGSVLLVGDAAGGVDPFSGEGIHHALMSGNMAAYSIIKGSDCKPQSIYDYYSAIYDKCYSWDRRLSLLLAILSWKKNDFYFNLLKYNPEILGWLETIMLHHNCYAQLLTKGLTMLPKYLGNLIIKPKPAE